jgi:hypothetical protein
MTTYRSKCGGGFWAFDMLDSFYVYRPRGGTSKGGVMEKISRVETPCGIVTVLVDKAGAASDGRVPSPYLASPRVLCKLPQL